MLTPPSRGAVETGRGVYVKEDIQKYTFMDTFIVLRCTW